MAREGMVRDRIERKGKGLDGTRRDGKGRNGKGV